MKPILYTDTETVFATNGIGMLSDAISATVIQELNGQLELTLKYPVTGIYAKAIADRCIILTKPDPATDPQPFRIYRINPVSKGTITIYARHIAYDTMGIPVAPFYAEGVQEALEWMKSNAAVDCPFNFSTDKNTAAIMNPIIPKSMWKTLGGSEDSILDVYGGEYEFDRYNIHLHKRRGADRGVSIRYGKNLKTLEQDKNCANVFTGVYPYWQSPDGELAQLPEKIIYADGTYNYTRIATVDFSSDFQEIPTVDQLRKRTQKYIADNDVGVPSVSLKVEFVQLEQTEEYREIAKLEHVLLGDSVTVVFPQMNVNASSRVVKTVYDTILERYTSITLGKIKSNLVDTIVTQKQQIEKKTDLTIVQRVAHKVSETEYEMTQIKQSAGEVSVEAADEDGTLVTRINANEWIAERKDSEGSVTSGFYYDFELRRFVYDGAGLFRSKDGKSYITLEGNEFVLYAQAGDDGDFIDIARIGFTEDSEGYDYPYFLMGHADPEGSNFYELGLLKMFKNGIYLGNSAPRNSTGSFVGLPGAAGFFVDTLNGIPYSVNGEEMRDRFVAVFM